MPTWLVHGFRWPRAQVRIHTILQNLDDVAPEWVMAPATQACLHNNFKEQWPELVARLPGLRFIEQYDPDDFTVKDQPYAYICDQVHDIKLGIDIEEVRERGVAEEQLAAISELRDKVTPDAKLGWFVVVNGDVERWAPPLEDEDDLLHGEVEEDVETKTLSPPSRSPRSSVWTGSNSDTATGQEPARPSTSRSMKSWLGGMLRKTRSSKSLRSEAKANPPPPVPPLPPMSPKAALEPQQSTENGKVQMPLRAAS
ncbi:hypothetical protein E8E13_007169 [Curvularia kusanoi]|uniref:Uncharacterized protein n=1 Tax=Curvularia kusanoi TaxID=90978 RepID=A0A9P4TNI6_CURKU|nr:hypothetical protein E8E13_007169 [Curvularia kusanoi]